jgi:hypothetical protein
MKVLTVYLRIYADALRQAVAGIGKNAWTVLLPIGLLYANNLASGLVMSIPYLGTFLVWIVWAAAASCYLYFLGEVVAKSKVKLDEFGRSIGAYFWSVANLFFVFWIAGLVVSLLQQQIFNQLLVLAAAILLNAAPEVIYQRGSYGGLETAQRCIRFLQENWIEWGIPNLLILAIWWFFPPHPLAGLGSLGSIIEAVIEGALVHLAMVFRGFLFAALDGTSHRQRMYRYRSTGAV